MRGKAQGALHALLQKGVSLLVEMTTGGASRKDGGARDSTPEEEELLQAMAQVLPSALEEVARGGKLDTSHWSWYAFPTSLRGRHDPRGTCVRADRAAAVAAAAPEEWREVLEMLSRDTGLCSLPTRDIGRVGAFVEFWGSVSGRPAWLGAAETDLRARLRERQVMTCYEN